MSDSQVPASPASRASSTKTAADGDSDERTKDVAVPVASYPQDLKGGEGQSAIPEDKKVHQQQSIQSGALTIIALHRRKRYWRTRRMTGRTIPRILAIGRIARNGR